MIARQSRSGLRHRGSQAGPPNPVTTDQPADLLVGHGRVGDDGQQIIQERLPVLPGLAPLGKRLAHLPPGLALPRGNGLVKQLHDLIEHIGRRLRQHRKQDRVAALRIAPFQRLHGQPAPDRGQEPTPLGGQHRQVQSVRAQATQKLQLGDLSFHRGRGRLDRPCRQPPQPRHTDLRVSHQQRVQRGAPGIGKLTRQPVERLPLRLLPRVRDPLHHSHRPGPEHPRRDQVLASQPEQQRRRVMLQRPSKQELIQLLELHRCRQPPPQILRHQPQMLGPGLHPPPVGPQSIRIDAQLISQPAHRHQWRRRHPVRHEPQPRQRTQRHCEPSRSAGPRPRPGSTNATSAGVRVKKRNNSSRPISGNPRSRSSSSSANTRAATQHLQPVPEDPQFRSPLNHIRPFFPEYYGDPLLLGDIGVG
ncbi:hypothetical protein PSET11_02482 [Arthrobacter ulcerisalmonis]|uniref:Uncharacterized protein n=1 Tax=Arthrobacter ulcerisalmonis TaxID=2483813 RepID=A0A3P5XJJ1_9MICC|nr:hypothetical protein PSET11_02482 [Arthrobacter ulcerisalmonis]